MKVVRVSEATARVKEGERTTLMVDGEEVEMEGSPSTLFADPSKRATWKGWRDVRAVGLQD